jgi:hypothetical protein
MFRGWSRGKQLKAKCVCAQTTVAAKSRAFINLSRTRTFIKHSALQILATEADVTTDWSSSWFFSYFCSCTNSRSFGRVWQLTLTYSGQRERAEETSMHIRISSQRNWQARNCVSLSHQRYLGTTLCPSYIYIYTGFPVEVPTPAVQQLTAIFSYGNQWNEGRIK